jgi:hypothetical protein
MSGSAPASGPAGRPESPSPASMPTYPSISQMSHLKVLLPSIVRFTSGRAPS